MKKTEIKEVKTLLTREQANVLLEENMGAIFNSFAHYGITDEDEKQEILLYLCQHLVDYDSSSSKISTFIYNMVKFRHQDYLTKENTLKRKVNHLNEAEEIRLDSPVLAKGGTQEGNLSYAETISDSSNVFTEELSLEGNLLLDAVDQYTREFLNTLTEFKQISYSKYRELFIEYLKSGLSLKAFYRNHSEEIGCTYCWWLAIVDKFREYVITQLRADEII